LALAVPVQIAIGTGRVRVIALSALAGAFVNLPISCYLATRLGVAGVIWGTILTTLVSNLFVPGVYLFGALGIEARAFIGRTLKAPMAGAAALITASWTLRAFMPVAAPSAGLWWLISTLSLHLGVGILAYVGGYLLVPVGRRDLARLMVLSRR
ncbi:polysaccharide biosynthesis protein, partial [Singulisphaera rosea]